MQNNNGDKKRHFLHCVTCDRRKLKKLLDIMLLFKLSI
jgi:hypothetical protein